MSVAKKINSEIIQPKKMGLLVENPVYKPFRYPWCYDAWLTQQRIHWLPEEVPLGAVSYTHLTLPTIYSV